MVEILHENSYGIKIERTDFKQRSQVKVVNYYNGGRYIHRTYRFKNIPDRFSSPFISWENLDCCGGWQYDEAYLAHAVQSGKKLYAGITISLKNKYLPNAPTLEEAISNLKQLQNTLSDELCAGIDSRLSSEQYLSTFICRRGTLKDYFELDAIFSFYEKLGASLLDHMKETVCQCCSVEISDFSVPSAPYEYYNAASQAELVTTGLLLGYPIESTASLLTGY